MIYEIGTIKLDITKHAREERTRLYEQKGEYPKEIDIDVAIYITMSSSKGVLEATAKIGRQKVGSTTIEYVADPGEAICAIISELETC